MNADTELDIWRRQWQSENSVPPDLRRRVERQSRWMRVMVAGDVLVTLVIGGGTIVLALRAPHPEMLLLAVATWLFIASAWAARWILNRGLWSPPAVHTEAFLELLIKRCRARLAASLFGAALYLCEIAFCAAWLYRYSSPVAWMPVWLGLVTALFFGSLAWYRRRQRAELAWLLALR